MFIEKKYREIQFDLGWGRTPWRQRMSYKHVMPLASKRNKKQTANKQWLKKLHP